VTETGGDEGGDQIAEEAGKLLFNIKKCFILLGGFEVGIHLYFFVPR
jgi:hypothetical protein